MTKRTDYSRKCNYAIKRFWRFVGINDPDKCWLWQAGTRGDSGYGCYGPRRGEVYLAHRYAATFFMGDLPKGAVVRHKCDVKLCVNPYHLEIGTQADNMRDMVERGRSLRGECHPHARLSNEAVRVIRESKGSETAKTLAIRYGVARSTVLAIWCGQNYAGVQ